MVAWYMMMKKHVVLRVMDGDKIPVLVVLDGDGLLEGLLWVGLLLEIMEVNDGYTA